MRLLQGLLLLGLLTGIAALAGISGDTSTPVASKWSARATTTTAFPSMVPAGFHGLVKQTHSTSIINLYQGFGDVAANGNWLPRGYPTASRTLTTPDTTRRFWTQPSPNPWLIYLWIASETTSSDSMQYTLARSKPYLTWRFAFEPVGGTDPFFCNPQTGMNLICRAEQPVDPAVTQLAKVRVPVGWYPLYANSWAAVLGVWLPTNYPTPVGMLGPNSPSVQRYFLAVPTGNHDFMQLRAEPFTDASPAYLIPTRMLVPAGTTECGDSCPHDFPGRFVSR